MDSLFSFPVGLFHPLQHPGFDPGAPKLDVKTSSPSPIFTLVDKQNLKAILRTALTERKENGCYHSMLAAVSRIYASRQLEAVAIEMLDDPDPQAVGDAALMLSWYGSAGAEHHLWKRLELWTAQHRGGSEELSMDLLDGDGVEFYQRSWVMIFGKRC
jgi:hypothetical protein